jgi:hypothetical protein
MNSVRAAKNESAYREVNQAIAKLQEKSPLPLPPTFICECSNTDCREVVEATLDEYSQVRAVATHFLLAHGHIDPDIERIVRTTDRFDVVEKFGLDAEIAEAEAL